ncbi:MAG: hypothetical protein JW997_07545 [Actinobacteria bacterium]|nr:hypothetical protein [Actinomycetota bacterium]
MARRFLSPIKNKLKKLFYSTVYSYPAYIFYDFTQRLNGYKKERKHVQKILGYYPDIKNPRSFNEKILYKKFYDRNPLLPIVSDKYRVREYIESVLGQKKAQKILVPLLYVTDNPQTIPFEELPKEYIIKPNHASGLLIIAENQYGKKKYTVVKHKVIKILYDSRGTRQEIIDICRGWLLKPHEFYRHEWAYQKIRRKIIIEKLLRDERGKIPSDYKLSMFHGKCDNITVFNDRYDDLNMGRYTHQWSPIYVEGKIKWTKYQEKPKKLSEMIQLAATLAKPFDYIRVDLYLLGNYIYFGELTNYPMSGAIPLNPVSYDLELGSKWNTVPNYWKYQ